MSDTTGADTTGTGLRGLAGGVVDDGADGLLVGIGARPVLVVPADAHGLRITDVSGRLLWSAHNLRPGARVELPARFARGVLRYRWLR